MSTRRTLAVLALAALVVSAALALPSGSNQVSAAGGAVSVSGGANHTCALLSDGGVQCWGRNDNGQLGDGTMNLSTTPVDVCRSGSGVGCSGGFALAGIIQVSVAVRYSCARTDDGRAYCWGSNDKGQLGNGSTLDSTTAVEVCATGAGAGCSALTGVTDIAAGRNSTCAVVDKGSVMCWGANFVGQLGIGSSDTDAHSHPERVCIPFIPPVVLSASYAGGLTCFAVTGYTSVDVGGTVACAVVGDGGVKCWGAGSVGQLGNGTTTGSDWPVTVCVPAVFVLTAGGCSPLSGAAEVSLYFAHACALLDGGGMRCWGQNLSGKLGDGTTTNRLIAVQVCSSGSGQFCSGGQALSGIVSMSVGRNHTCVIAEAGDARCWGVGSEGRLGNGMLTDQHLPGPVSGISSGAVSIGAGESHSCIGLSDGSVKCMGGNSDGELGIGSTDNDPHAFPSTVSGFGPKATTTPTSPGDTPTSTPVIPTDTQEPGPTDTPAVSTDTPAQGATNTPTPPANGLIGDVDCSGGVNSIDAALILQFVAGLLGTLPCPENADTNGDGDINSIDAALILQLSAGLIDSLSP